MECVRKSVSNMPTKWRLILVCATTLIVVNFTLLDDGTDTDYFYEDFIEESQGYANMARRFIADTSRDKRSATDGCVIPELTEEQWAELKQQKLHTFRIGATLSKSMSTKVCNAVSTCESDSWQVQCDEAAMCNQYHVIVYNITSERSVLETYQELSIVHSVISETLTNIYQHYGLSIGRTQIPIVILGDCIAKGTIQHVNTYFQLNISFPDHCVRTYRQNGQPEPHNDAAKTSINIMYLHFLSRWQMLAWLPKTRAILANLRERPGVYDFTKFQSIFVHQHESLQSFLNGYPTRLTINDSAPDLEVTSWLKLSTAIGYRPYIFDLSCSTSNKRKDILSTFFDELGITKSHKDRSDNPASLSEKFTSFFCKNAYSANTQLLRHLVEFFQNSVSMTTKKHKVPSLTVTLLNAADIKTTSQLTSLDLTIADFLERAMSMQDSISLLLSDIGHVFTHELSSNNAILQAQLSNSILVVALPVSISHTMPTHMLLNLRHNERKLVTVDSVRTFLQEMLIFVCETCAISEEYIRLKAGKWENNKWNGLLDALPGHVTCSDVRVLSPNMCICEGQSVQYTNDSLQVGFAELGLGELNNAIKKMVAGRQSRFVESERNVHDYSNAWLNPNSNSYHGYYRISGLNFSNVDVSRAHDSIIRVLNVTLLEPICSETNEPMMAKIDTITFVIKSDLKSEHLMNTSVLFLNVIDNSLLPLAELARRILSECLVESGSHVAYVPSPRAMLLGTASPRKHFGVTPRPIHIRDQCLFLFIRDFKAAVTFEIMNACDVKSGYLIRFDLRLQGMVSLKALPLHAVSVSPLQCRFLTTIVRASYFVSKTDFHFRVHVID